MSVIWFRKKHGLTIHRQRSRKGKKKKTNNPNDVDLLNKKGHISKVQNLLYEYEITLKACIYINVLIID